MDVRELHLYSPKIQESEIRDFFNLIIKSGFPFLGFISFKDTFALNALGLIMRRNENTVRLFVREKPNLNNLSALVFPFRLSTPSSIDEADGSVFPIPKFFFISGASHDVLDFMLKADITELSVGISKFFGGFFAFGHATDSTGKTALVMIFKPQKFFVLDMEKNPSIYIELLEPLPKKVHMVSACPVFEDGTSSIGIDNYDALQHSLIVGTSGAGKSKALYVLLRAIASRHGDDVRIIVIDPHGEFAGLIPEAQVIDFVNNYIEPLDVGGKKSPMLTQLIAQLISSTIGQDNKYSERVLFYTIHLLSSLDRLELGEISRLLTDNSAKAELVSKCDNPEVKRFFDEEYNDIYIHHFNTAILPILNFIGEYQLYLGKEKKRESLEHALKENSITVVSFNPNFFGRRMISFLAGAIINQMYIQAITGSFADKPTILVVDEFPRVETRVTRDILSETRKFNLFAYLSCQYLGQLSKEVLDSMVSNVRNVVAFKCNRQDAAMLSSIMEIKVEEYFKKSRATTELEESKKEMFVRLNQRECIVRLFDGKKYLLPMKLRVVDAARWGFKENRTTHAAEAPPDEPDAGGMETKPPKPVFPNPMEEGGHIDLEEDQPSSDPSKSEPPKSGIELFCDKGLPEGFVRKPSDTTEGKRSWDDDGGAGSFAVSVDERTAKIKHNKRKLRKDELGL